MKRIFSAGPSITELEERVVLDALRHGWYEHPYDYVEKFQAEFAAWHRRAHGVMTPNCTAALHLVYASLGIGPGDEVIVPECTWIATVAPVVQQGAHPVFCDIDPRSWCLDPDSVRRRVSPRTKAIVAVDLYGNMPELEAFGALADECEIPLIEDAAEALGSVRNGVRAGKFGLASVFSFHRTKTLTTGEGGMLLTDDEDLYARAMFLRDHGRTSIPYWNSESAFKYMPFNLQAALGWAQFQRVEELVAMKRQLLAWYRAGLADIPDLELNFEPPGVTNGAWGPTVVFGRSHRLTKTDALARLAEAGVPARPFFYPLSSLPAFPKHDEAEHRRMNPVAYDVSSRGITLPCALNLEEDDVARVCEAIRELVERRR
jgi:perosamine synthetase